MKGAPVSSGPPFGAWPALPDVPGRLLGVDVGGSGTRGLVVERGTVVGQLEAPGMNALLDSDAATVLGRLAVEARADAVGVGMPGARSEADTDALAAAVAEAARVPVRVAPDVEAARDGAFLGRPGVVVVAGTGSVAVGWDGERRARAGGHGFLLGDEGGAWWIGREAVGRALRAGDTGRPSDLADAVVAAAGRPLESLVQLVHRAPADRAPLASLAPVVTALAAEDPDAEEICARAAAHLVELVRTVQAHLGPLPVVATGGVLQAPAVREPVVAATGAASPAAPPTVGAVLLAVRASGARGPDRGA